MRRIAKLTDATPATIALGRREFLRSTAGLWLAPSIGQRTGAPPLPASRRKAVVVTFGGGARDDETFMPEGHENIPHLLSELLPQATFFSQVVNHGILGHYVANASLATGVYETINNFVAAPPEHPTVFEYFRKDLKRPVTDAWAIAPSVGFDAIGSSRHPMYGRDFGASVVLPKRLLSATLPPESLSDFASVLHDNYERPLQAPEAARRDRASERLSSTLQLSVADFVAGARELTSPDELSVFIARRVMRHVAPSLLWITLHDIDVAHAGAFSLYVDAIRRTDRLVSDIWRMIQGDPEYAGRTTLFVLPDFGRDSDEQAGGNGFQHHRTGDARSRTTWMMVLGPGVRENVVIDRPLDSLDLVPTLGAYFGFSPRFARGTPVASLFA